MAKEIDKIIQSKTAPKSNNVLWDDGENLKINRNGKWDSVLSPISDETLESIYFYTVPVEVMEKIYNLEDLSISEGEEIYKNALKAYKVVFPENTIQSENTNQFYELGYIEVGEEVSLFDLNQILFDIVDGVVTMSGYIYIVLLVKETILL